MVSKKVILAGVAVLALLGAGVAMAASQANANDTPSAPVQKDKRMCDPCRGLAAFRLQDGVVSGRNVGFTVDAQTGAISDYTSRGPWGDAVVFESISFADANGSALKDATHGPVFVERDGPDFSFAAFDARNAAFVATSAQGNVVTLKVLAGTNVTTFAAQKGWSPAGALLSKDGHEAKLVLRGNASVAYDGAGTLTVTLGPHSHLWFRIVGYPGEAVKERRWVHEAAEHRKARKA